MSKSRRKANLTFDRAVAALTWQVGDPAQYEVKDIDHPGYYMRISRGGAKTWLFRYMLNGSLKRRRLGRYPGVDCLEAFTRYCLARQQLDDGLEVSAFSPAPLVGGLCTKGTVLTVSELFHDHFYPRYASLKKSKKNYSHYFTSKIEPVLGKRSIDEVKPADVEKLIRPIEVNGYNTARLTLGIFRKMFNWGLDPISAEHPGDGPLIAEGLLNPCRHYRLNPANKPKPIDRYLKADEIRRIWNALGDDNASRIIKLQLLTGCRVGEVCGMTERELDREAGEWIIPAERVKTGRPHLVALTDTMLGLIGPISEGVVFKARSKAGFTTNYAVNQRLKRVCKKLSIDSVSTHTMRRTFITHLARLGVSVELRNRLTNHADRSVDGLYNMHDYARERREVLVRWGREVLSLLIEHF